MTRIQRHAHRHWAGYVNIGILIYALATPGPVHDLARIVLCR